MGAGALRETGVLDRLIRLSYASGVRTFDTAKAYGTEPGFKKWFEQDPEVRKQIVLVTKDNPPAPPTCWRWSTSGWRPWGPTTSTSSSSTGWATTTALDEAINFVKSQEFKETADAIRKSGKAKFIGFSTHHRDRAQLLQAAAEGGIIDAIMLQYTPWLDKDSPLNKALDACHEQGDRPDLDEADRRPVPRRRPKGNILEEVVQPGADAGREEADALPGPAARDLDRRADQRVLRLDAKTPTRSARTPTPPAATSR